MRRDGFSLIEMIVVITLTGILAGFISSFISRPLAAYNDASARVVITTTAEGALRRIGRDIRRSLPNSVRVGGSGTALEFFHVADGARYRASGGINADTSADHTAASDVLTFSGDTSFNTIGRLGGLSFSYGVALSAGHRIAIYTTDTTVWSNAATSANPGLITPASTTITLANDTDEDQIALSTSHEFSLASPRAHFFVVDTPVSFICDTSAGTLTRYDGYTPASSQPTNPAVAPLSSATAAVLAQNVSSCDFRYSAGTSARAGLVTLELGLSSGGESVRLLHQAHVANVP